MDGNREALGNIELAEKPLTDYSEGDEGDIFELEEADRIGSILDYLTRGLTKGL